MMVMVLLPLQGYYHAPAAGAAESAIVSDADYIVCYREDSVHDRNAERTEDSSVPFDVVDGRELRHLLQEDSLEWFEEDGEAVLLEDSDDPPAEDISWNLAMICADDASLGSYRGQGVRVGVIDSGVRSHPDLAANLLPGCNYITGTGDPENTTDNYGHGTKVAGLLAASGGDSRIGAAPEASIVPLKCTDGKSVKISTICRAIYGGIDDFGCEVLNLSLGVKTDYQSLREAIAYAAEKDVVVVSAVGNGGTRTEYYPAAYKTVIGVGSVDRTESWYDRSNYNNSVFVMAPGVDVLSTSRFGGYEEGTGCSFAVPQVSAAAAVMRSIDPSLSVEKVMQILSETARDKGSAGYDQYYGYGILNIGACVEALAGGGDDPPDPPVPPDLPVPCDGGPDCPLRTFADLDSGAWYHDSLHFVLENNIMNGYGNGLFGPQDHLNRAMMVVMLWRMDGMPEAEYAIPFTDTDPDSWYTEALRWAAAEKLVTGYRDTQFGPSDAITREQLAAMLYRYAIYQEKEASISELLTPAPWDSFIDVQDVSGWAQDAVRWCVQEEVLCGDDMQMLRPAAPVTRTEAAAMLSRYE